MSYTYDSVYLMAGNPATSPADLERLASKPQSQNVRLRLAENPSSTLDILIQLAADEYVDVRIAVAGNPSTPDWLKAALAKDESATVRFALAEDCNTAFEILLLLKEDENAYVSNVAQSTIDSLELETALKEAGFVAEPGDCFKLGYLISKSGLLSEIQIQELLLSARGNGIPLGQAIARAKALPKRIITKALLLQSQLRKNEISEAAMIESLSSGRQGQLEQRCLEIARFNRITLAKPA